MCKHNYRESCRNLKDDNFRQDKIRGCLFGGAVGDALGYPVEFMSEEELALQYGEKGICQYEIDRESGKALISDDTQMTLFTANGIIAGDTRMCLRGIGSRPSAYVAKAYQDWLRTQEMSFSESRELFCGHTERRISWLADVPELYHRRAPGSTCLFALRQQKNGNKNISDYISQPQNDSKGCGGIMRIAPLALNYQKIKIEKLDMEGAEIAAITHGHSLGYMPAAVLTHIINRIVYPEKNLSLKEIVLEAEKTAEQIFSGDKHLDELTHIIDLAVRLSENSDSDIDNINAIGEGWVAEETLGIAIYCALRYHDNFSAGIIAAVNHKGDSDSTGAVTGNILGAMLGYSAIEEKWKNNIELADIILEIADDLCFGCRMSEYSSYRDADWTEKYIHMRALQSR